MFEIITKTNELHAPLLEAIKAGRTRNEFDYNGLVTALNKAKSGQIVIFDFKARRVPALVEQLTKRGLKRDTDYSVGVINAAEEGQEPHERATVVKLSATEGTHYTAQRGRPKA